MLPNPGIKTQLHSPSFAVTPLMRLKLLLEILPAAFPMIPGAEQHPQLAFQISAAPCHITLLNTKLCHI